MASDITMLTRQYAPGRVNASRGSTGRLIDGGVLTNLFELKPSGQLQAVYQYDGSSPPNLSIPHIVHGTNPHYYERRQRLYRSVVILLPRGRTNRGGAAQAKPQPTPQSASDAKPPPRRFLDPIIHYLMYQAYPEFFPRKGFFDGRSILYLLDAPFAAKNFEFKMDNEAGDYTVILTRAADLPFSVIRNLLVSQPDPARVTDSDPAIASLQAMLRTAALPRANFIATKRSVFEYSPDFKKHVTLAPGLVLLKGLFMSVRPALGKMMVNVDVSNLVVHKWTSLIEYCLDILETRRLDALAAPMSSSNANNLKIGLRRLQVAYNKKHPLYAETKTAGQPKRFTIAGFTTLSAETFKFVKDEEKISIKNYFATHKKGGVRLEYPDLVCAQLKTGPNKPPQILPLEFLDVPPGQVFKSLLTPVAAKSMIENTSEVPSKRLQNIKKRFDDIMFNKSEVARVTSMAIAPEPIIVQNARRLDPRQIHFGGDSHVQTIDQGNWGWNAGRDSHRKKTYRLPATIEAWAIVNFDRAADRRDVSNLAGALKSTLQQRGLKIQQDPQLLDESGSQVGVKKTLDNAYQKLNKASKYPPKPSNILIVCILQLPKDDLRANIKAWSDTESGGPGENGRGLGIATQIVITPKLRGRREDDAYLNNLALKINVKLGGQNHGVRSSWLERNRAVVVGADVSHPSPGAIAPSIAAVTCSVSETDYIAYTASVQIQGPRQEVIFDFARLVFNKIVPIRPQRVVIFRDGVSESQFQIMFTHELKSLRDYLFKKVPPPGVPPKLTYVIVGKRHHVRFFPNENRSNVDHKSGNFVSGLVVDDDVVHPVYRDFYLQSQKPLKGTSRPAHYTVLWDENNISTTDLEEMIYDLCHIQGRSTTPISIPAPVHYADLACARSRLHLRHTIYGSEGGLSEDSGTITPQQFQQWQHSIRIHPHQQNRMYWM